MAVKKSKPSPILTWLVSWIVPAYIRLVGRTVKWERLGEENFNAALNAEEGMIVAFWHGRILMMIEQRRRYKKPFWFMMSNHRDAETLISAVKAFDISFARGSSANPKKKSKNKKGHNAFRLLLKALQRKEGVGLTPDGPRGPIYKCQIGAVHLSAMSGIPIYPMAYSVEKAKFIMKSWDRFLVPFPFSKGVFITGEPMYFSADTDEQVEEGCYRLAQELNRLTYKADTMCGHDGIAELPEAEQKETAAS